MDERAILTIEPDGNLPLNAPVLAHLGVHPGDSIVFELLPGGRVQVRAPTGIEAFFSCIPYDGPAVSLEAMQDAIMAAAAHEPLE